MWIEEISKVKQQTPPAQQQPIHGVEVQRALFGIHHPVNASNLKMALAAGITLQADKIPIDLLPCVVLLCTVGLRSFDQQIVDDYGVLIDRMNACFDDPNCWHDQFWHPELWLVSFICIAGPRGEYFLDTTPEAQYLFEAYQELVNTSTEQLLGD